MGKSLRKGKIWIFFIFFTAFAYATNAQNVDEQMWFEYMLNYPFANTYNVEGAFTYSTTLSDPRWRAFDFQVTPEVSITRNIDLSTSLLGSSTFQNDTLQTFELRPAFGARFHFTQNKRIQTRLFVRFEQRHLKDLESGDWFKSNRTRARIETLIPINGSTMFSGDKLWYGILDAEWFFVLDNDVAERFANRFRMRAGIGYRLNYNLRFEFVFTNQQSKQAIGESFYSSDNIFRFRIKQYLRKTKPSTAVGTGN